MTQQVNTQRALHHLQRSAQRALTSFVGMPNTEETRLRLKSLIEQQVQQYSQAFNACKVDVEEPMLKNGFKRDLLAEECNSVEEYKMRKAVETGEVPDVNETEFNEMHDPSIANELHVNVTVQPTHALQYVQLELNAKDILEDSKISQ